MDIEQQKEEIAGKVCDFLAQRMDDKEITVLLVTQVAKEVSYALDAIDDIEEIKSKINGLITSFSALRGLTV